MAKKFCKCALRRLVFFLAFGYDMELDREKEFRTFLAEKFPSVKRGTSGVFHKEFGDKIKAAIKDPSSADKNMCFFGKKKRISDSEHP